MFDGFGLAPMFLPSRCLKATKLDVGVRGTTRVDALEVVAPLYGDGHFKANVRALAAGAEPFVRVKFGSFSGA